MDIAHRLWANSGIPGELTQVLPSPQHFERASTLFTPQMTRESVTCGADAAAHLKAFEHTLTWGSTTSTAPT